MADSLLCILAFDHRQVLRELFSRSGEDSKAAIERFGDGKALVLEGLEVAASALDLEHRLGILLDEEYGAATIHRAKELGFFVCVPIEKSMQPVFELENGADLEERLTKLAPDMAKALIFYNPEGDKETNAVIRTRLRTAADRLRTIDLPLMVEVLVPATKDQLEAVGGDIDRYDGELRASLVVRALGELQSAGIIPAIWKLEGLDTEADYAAVAAQAAAVEPPARCLVLGRGADVKQVEHWLEGAARTDGFDGFAIGRSIWADPLLRYWNENASRAEAVSQVGESYASFVRLYDAIRRKRAST